MILINRILRHLNGTTTLRNNIKPLRISYGQQCFKNARCVSTVEVLSSKEFRKKTEHFSFTSAQHNDTDSDSFGTLTNKVETNEKLNTLPPEDDDIIQFDKDELHKRLHITEYHKIIQDLIKQQKVSIKQ